jgi:hypothetical protein
LYERNQFTKLALREIREVFDDEIANKVTGCPASMP